MTTKKLPVFESITAALKFVAEKASLKKAKTADPLRKMRANAAACLEQGEVHELEISWDDLTLVCEDTFDILREARPQDRKALSDFFAGGK